MSRPFAVGDLVVLTNGKVAVAHTLFGDGVWLDNGISGNKIWVDKYNEFDKVKTIRTPRKGGKEARDIVAMLLRETLNQRRFIHLGYRVKGMKASYEDILVAHDDIYYGLKTFEKAKSMLGGRNA